MLHNLSHYHGQPRRVYVPVLTLRMNRSGEAAAGLTGAVHPVVGIMDIRFS
jgi:hypothetical protein